MTNGERGTTDGGEGVAASSRGLAAVAWLWVGLPLLYGLYELIQEAAQLFTG
jgi:hypothetical protein